MPNQTPAPSIQNHFQEGLKTEFTGLNFPENAATSTSNCVYTILGDVTRRGGINYENHFNLNNIGQSSVAYSSYKWTNVGGDGQTQILVQQVGNTLYFFQATNSTVTSPLSTTLLASIVNITTFQVAGNINNPSITECQFTDGNGYLFVFHKDCEPFYCTFNSSNQSVLPTMITIQMRDFVGVPDGLANNFRPTSLSSEHQYNLQNQGWTSGSAWTATIYNNNPETGPTNPFAFPTGTFANGASITIPVLSQTNTTSITNGSQIVMDFFFVQDSPNLIQGALTMTVTNYSAPFTSITGILTNASITFPLIFSYVFGSVVKMDNLTTNIGAATITARLANAGFISTWLTQVGNYPSNSDVWWLYKDTTNVFHPAVTIPSVQQAFGPAPKGYYILNAFTQQRATASSLSGITDIVTTTRPTTGCWYQGRVFYAGINASQQATGDQPYTTWTENIYFSKTVITPTDFGQCYQINDPTSQDLFSLLPTDGGVITIQGCGQIYKLFALRYGLIVFAANGIWFISGSTGMGFTASDYVVTKISNIQCISSTSFIDVMGFPFFWNAEGIYQVVPSQQPGSAHSPDIQLDVKNMCVGTILTYFNNIPQPSLTFVRGDYDKINYIVTWLFRSTTESGIANRYTYDTVLCYNTVTKAFYPYSLQTTSSSTICDIKYIQLPGTVGGSPPVLKYITQKGTNMTFSEENDFTGYLDFFSENSIGYNYVSSFTSGYTLPGQGTRKIQIPYLYMFFREPANSQIEIQAVWDYAISRSSGKWSSKQLITNNINPANFNMLYRRVRLRGRGMAVQIQASSVQGQPFDIMGWSIWNVVNPGV